MPAGWHDKVSGSALKPGTWRKSSEFFTLIRPHAALVVNDTVVDPIFAHELCQDPDKDNRHPS